MFKKILNRLKIIIKNYLKSFKNRKRKLQKLITQGI